MPSPRPEPPAFIIREAREADLPQLQALENVVFPRGVAYSPGAFRNQLQKFKAGFLVCVAQGKVIGYATAELWRSGTRFDAHQLPGQKHDPKGRTLYISSMAVYSGNQGRGIGRRLLHALLNVGRKRGCSKAKLVSRKTLTGAHAFYQKHGFKRVRTLPGYFTPKGQPPVDGFVFSSAIKRQVKHSARTSAARPARPWRAQPRRR